MNPASPLRVTDARSEDGQNTYTETDLTAENILSDKTTKTTLDLAIRDLHSKINKETYHDKRFRILTQERNVLYLKRVNRCLEESCSTDNDKHWRLQAQKKQIESEIVLWDNYIRFKEATKDDKYDLISFFQVWSTSKLGWAHDISLGRDRSAQSNFRRQLIKYYNAKDPQRDKSAWCPITRRYVELDITRAAHIFPARHGEMNMRNIFGIKDELFHSKNGLLMSTKAENRFDKAFFAIVPLLHEDASASEIREWQRGSRSFKIKIFNFDAKDMQEPLPDGSGFPKDYRWQDLDNEEVKFLSGARPRSRYLYFHYLFCLDRAMIKGPHNARAKLMGGHLSRKCWASTGAYIEKSYLRAFADTLGHEYSHLTDNARGEDDIAPLYGLGEAFAAQASFAARYREQRTDVETESRSVTPSDDSVCDDQFNFED